MKRIAFSFPFLLFNSIGLADWTQFRGPNGAGISKEPAAPLRWSEKENLVWKKPLPGAGSSSPIVFGERIYVTCYSGYNEPGKPGEMDQLKHHLICLDRASGALIWQKDLRAKLPEQPRIRDDHGYATQTPAADADAVYAFFGKSGVYAFDHKGNQLWHKDVGEGLNGWGSAASPVLYKHLVFINASVESGSLIALDKKTGNEVWRARGIKESWNSPILVKTAQGDTELAVAILGDVLGFDPEKGDRLWNCKTDIGWYMVPGLVEEKGILYCIGGRSGGALAVKPGGRGNVTATHRLWTGRKGSNVSTPIAQEGHLYWANDATGVAYCAKLSDGSIVYEERLDRGDQIYASPILVGSHLYYITRRGQAYTLPAAPRFEVVATSPPFERDTFNSSPAVDGARLLLRSNKHLYCIGER